MNTNNKIILIADDDIDYLAQLKYHVENFGFGVVTASSEADCLKIIESQKPDLAIFDLMMNNDDSGFILSYKLKKKYPEVPVMIVTSATSITGLNFEPVNDSEKSWIKADRYLAKGIRPDQLHREISKLLKL